MAIPLPVYGAIQLLGEDKITAFDTVTSRVDGRATTPQRGTDYTFQGSIQFATDKQMARLPEGFQSTATLVIRTDRKLFFIDNKNPTGNELRQTYVIHFGEQWRIVSEANWIPTGSFFKYLAQKHIER